MAENPLAITPTSIRTTFDCKSRVKSFSAGGVLVIGEIAYLSEDGLYRRSFSSGTQEQALGSVFVLTGASSPNDTFVGIDGSCTFNPGSPLIKGLNYVLASTPGKIIIASEWTTSKYKTQLAIAISANTWVWNPQQSGVTGV